MRYLIDGYNVIHALAPLQAIAATNIESARDALVELTAVLVKPGDSVVIVFDGKGPMTNTEPALPGVDGFETVYTSQNVSADSWIERTVHRSKQRHYCTVITADGGIRDLCRGLGARVFSPDWLESHAARSRSGGANRYRPTNVWSEPGERFDTDSRDRLNAIRERLEKEGDVEKDGR